MPGSATKLDAAQHRCVGLVGEALRRRTSRRPHYRELERRTIAGALDSPGGLSMIS